MLERLRHPRGASKAPRPLVTVTHFADPFCWWSFGLEPVLRRLQAVYGDQLAIEYRMGGVFTDIAAWRRDYNVDERTTIDWTRESAATTGNPVDVDYMRKTGVRSTHPACLAFKAAQLQDHERADAFFRRMMVAFQVECRPATEATLNTLAVEAGLDPERLERDARSAPVQRAFDADMAEMERAQVGFHTLSVTVRGKTQVLPRGFTSAPIEAIIDQLAPGLPKGAPGGVGDYLRAHEGLNTAREVSEVLGRPDASTIAELERLESEGHAVRVPIAGAVLWRAGAR